MGKPTQETQGSTVKEAIFSTLMALLRKKHLSEVTITELARKAGVSRMAFYRNYSSKDDIIVKYLDEQFESFLAKIRKAKDPNAYQDAYWYFTFFKRNQALVEKLIGLEKPDLVVIDGDNISGDRCATPEDVRAAIANVAKVPEATATGEARWSGSRHPVRWSGRDGSRGVGVRRRPTRGGPTRRCPSPRCRRIRPLPSAVRHPGPCVR